MASLSGMLPVSAQTEGMICQDRVWEYVRTTYSYDGTSTLYQMKFDGTVEVNGHIYHRFVNFSGAKYDDGMQGEGIPLEESDLRPASYYREEGDITYILMQGDSPAVGDIDPQLDYSETVMMDFSLPEGSVFPDDLYKMWYDSLTLHVHYMDSDDDDVTGTERRYFELYEIADGENIYYKPIFGEGIGLTTGILPYIELEWTTGMWESFLLSVKQGDEFIYKDRWYGFDGVEAVEGVMQAPELKDGMVCLPGTAIAIFDIAGRKVAEGVGEVAVSHLPQGMYVAQAGSKTLKFLAR